MSEPLLLLIDACGAEGTVALARGTLIVEEVRMPGRSCAVEMVPAIRRLLAEHAVGLASLAGIGVISGPGSFTGMRIGLGIAKGLAFAGNVPMIAVSSLALLAHRSNRRQVVAVMDAGRGDWFAGFFDGSACVEERLLSSGDLASKAAGQMVVTQYARLVDVAGASAEVQLLDPSSAADALDLVLQRLKSRDFSDVGAVDANYLRQPAAVENLA